MEKLKRGLVLILCVIGMLVVFAGCSQPKIITAIDSKDDTMKLIYSDGDTDVGLFVCNIGEDGSLTNCKDKPLEFKD